MDKIIGVTVGTTSPRPNWAQSNEKKSDYIKNKPELEGVDLYVVLDETGLINYGEIIKSNGGTILLVETLPENLAFSAPNSDALHIYLVKSTGVGYVDFGSGAVSLGQHFNGSKNFDKGWSTNINEEIEEGFYFIRKIFSYGTQPVGKAQKQLILYSSTKGSTKKFKLTVDDNGTADITRVFNTDGLVESSFDNTGDGIPEVYEFSKELPTHFRPPYTRINAVNDIIDDRGVHQEPYTHYMKYDEVAAGIGTLPPHVYCYDNSDNYLRYLFEVEEDGIYELAAHVRIKDEQLRGATYTIDKGTKSEQSFVTTYGWDSEEEALAMRNDDQGAYMSGMLVYLQAGLHYIRITTAAGVTKNQHFRNLYLVKIADLPKYPTVITMDEAEVIGVNLAKGAMLPEYKYIKVTFNNGAPRGSDGFCRVITSNGRKMSIHRITLDDGQTMPLEGETVTLRCKLGCVNSTVNGDIGKEARIFHATIITQEKTVDITSNGTVEIPLAEGNALTKVIANVNVPSEFGYSDVVILNHSEAILAVCSQFGYNEYPEITQIAPGEEEYLSTATSLPLFIFADQGILCDYNDTECSVSRLQGNIISVTITEPYTELVIVSF